MSNGSFQLKICTPARMVADESAERVTLPGAEGEIEVLPMHRNYVGLLQSGVLAYLPEHRTDTRRMFVAGGVCSFVGNTLTVLADQVDLPEEIDRQGGLDQQGELNKIMAAGNCEDPERLDAAAKLKRIECLERLFAR